MKSVEFHPEAKAEAREAAAYYRQVRPQLGLDFRSELRTALQRIRNNPLLYAAEVGDIRVCPQHRFPYLIFYEVFPDRIWIAAVAHQGRRPGYWATRQPG